jgi:uncharacterized protein (TIGR03435 family)
MRALWHAGPGEERKGTHAKGWPANSASKGGSPSPDDAPTSADPAPSVFEAVKTYGLRLEARKAPLEMLTVIHLEKMPTEN